MTTSKRGRLLIGRLDADPSVAQDASFSATPSNPPQSAAKMHRTSMNKDNNLAWRRLAKPCSVIGPLPSSGHATWYFFVSWQTVFPLRFVCAKSGELSARRSGWSSCVVVGSAHMFAIPYFLQLEMLFSGNKACNACDLDCFPMKKMREGYCFAGRGKEFAMLPIRLL